MTEIVEYRVPPMPQRRDPSAATVQTSWQGKGQPMIQEWDARQAIEWGYLANTFVWAGARAIAMDLSRLPLRVGDPTTKSFDTAHPMAVHFGPVPGGPNPVTSARKLLAWSIVQYVITGRVGWEIERASTRGRPVAYWPLPTSHLRAIPSESGARYFDRFEYGPAHAPTKLPAERVFYTWEPAAHDWRQAESRLQAARLDISIAVMSDRYDYAFLANDSRPAAIIVHEAFEKKEQRDAWRRQFVAHHRGPDNAGNVAFTQANGSGGVADAIDVKTLGLSQKDAQSIQRYDAKVRGILVALGVPLSRIGDSSDRTFSNAGQEWTNYWEGTLLPIALDFADAMAMQLSPLYGTGGGVPYFDTSGVAALQAGRNLQPAPVLELVKIGAATKNDARAVGGLPRVEDPEFDAYEVAPAPVAQVPSGGELPAVPMPDPAEGMGTAAAKKDQVRAPVSGPGAREIRAQNLWRSADAQIRTLETRWKDAFARLFDKQRKAVLDRLEGKRGRQMLTRASTDLPNVGKELFDPAFWTASTQDIASGLYADVFAVGGARVAEKFGIAFDVTTPGVQDAITRRAHQLAGQVTDTTYRAIRDQLHEAVALGEGIPEMADRIGSVFDTATSSRATTIARTEVISAYNGSQTDAARDLPADVVGGQEWIATRDDRTREDHADADGQVVGVNEMFDVGGEPLAYPGDENGSPGNVISCRCTLGWLTPDEMPDARARTVERRIVERALARVALGLDSLHVATRELEGSTA